MTAKTGLRRGKPLARRSPKRVAADRVRADVREQVIARDGRCQAGLAALDLLHQVAIDHRLAEWLDNLARRCRGFDAHDVHEPVARSRGGDPLDPDQCLLLCRRCHEDIHAHPAFAREAQLTKRRNP